MRVERARIGGTRSARKRNSVSRLPYRPQAFGSSREHNETKCSGLPRNAHGRTRSTGRHCRAAATLGSSVRPLDRTGTETFPPQQPQSRRRSAVLRTGGLGGPTCRGHRAQPSPRLGPARGHQRMPERRTQRAARPLALIRPQFSPRIRLPDGLINGSSTTNCEEKNITASIQQATQFHAFLAAAGRSPEIPRRHRDMYRWLVGDAEMDIYYYKASTYPPATSKANHFGWVLRAVRSRMSGSCHAARIEQTNSAKRTTCTALPCARTIHYSGLAHHVDQSSDRTLRATDRASSRRGHRSGGLSVGWTPRAGGLPRLRGPQSAGSVNRQRPTATREARGRVPDEAHALRHSRRAEMMRWLRNPPISHVSAAREEVGRVVLAPASLIAPMPARSRAAAVPDRSRRELVFLELRLKPADIVHDPEHVVGDSGLQSMLWSDAELDCVALP